MSSSIEFPWVCELIHSAPLASLAQKPDTALPKLPGLVIPLQPLLDYSGPPTRRRAVTGAMSFAASGLSSGEISGREKIHGFGGAKRIFGKGFEDVSEEV